LQSSFKADGYIVVVTILAAISWIFSKEALSEMPPLLFIGSRFLIAGVFLVFFSKSSLGKLSFTQWKTSSLVGLLFGLSMSLWIFGLFYTSSLGEGAFITSINSVLVAPLSYFLFKTAVPKVTWVALPITMIGLALLSLENGFKPEPSQLFFFFSAVLLSLTFTLNGLAAAKIPAPALTAISLTLVGFIALMLSVALESWPSEITKNMMLWLLLSAFIGTACRFLLQTYAQGLTSPSHAAVIMVLEPIWTAIIAAAWFDERMSAVQLVGCGLIFTSLLLNRWSSILQLMRGR
jgi:drug/metabolite transporter (DMT)-like permease